MYVYKSFTMNLLTLQPTCSYASTSWYSFSIVFHDFSANNTGYRYPSIILVLGKITFLVRLGVCEKRDLRSF